MAGDVCTGELLPALPEADVSDPDCEFEREVLDEELLELVEVLVGVLEADVLEAAAPEATTLEAEVLVDKVPNSELAIGDVVVGDVLLKDVLVALDAVREAEVSVSAVFEASEVEA